MPKVKYTECSVKNGAMQVTHVSVPAWELPLLQAANDTAEVQNVTVLGEKWITREVPDAAEEYHRLSRRYKPCKNPDGSPGPEIVSQVYGARPMGVNNLANAMRSGVVAPVVRAVAEDTTEKADPTNPTPPSAKRKRGSKAGKVERIAKANAERLKGEAAPTAEEVSAAEGLLG